MKIMEKMNEESQNNAEDAAKQKEMTESAGQINEETGILQTKVQELEDKLIRSLAEAENIRKRYVKMLEEAKEYAVSQFSKDILAIMDNLNLALTHKEEANVIAGVELTQKELTTLFKKYNIEEISPNIGEKFDYNLHNAISEVESTEYSGGSILNILQIGYKLKDRLLRPALVQVVKGNH